MLWCVRRPTRQPSSFRTQAKKQLANCKWQLARALSFSIGQRQTTGGHMKLDPNGNTNRRSFLISSAAAAGLVLYPESSLFSQAASTPPASTVPTASQVPANKARPDPLKPELVKEFVSAAHVDLEKTKT